MKKIIFIVLAGLFLGACAQKTCPTYTFNDIPEETELLVSNKI